MRASADIRFWAKVDQDGDCWRWTAELNNDGYPRFWVNGHKVLAHRWAYEQMVSEIPEGLEIDHRCFNRACVNPEHLEPVPPAVNRRRRKRPAQPKPARVARQPRTHCGRGHELTPENTRLREGNRRACRICIRANRNAYRARRRSRI